METRKLFYEDPHTQTFSATVMACEAVEKGWEIQLNQTAFYPEGGGQACDLGTLGSAQVLDVQEQGEAILHLCSRALEVGATVHGEIDWAHRFDLMQQHTGEHIVSGIIHKRYGFHNTGFHAGSDGMEVDFSGVIPAEDIPEIELMANRFIWADLPVRCWYPTRTELPAIPYRTKRELPWPVRIVEIPGADTCACCGIHVAATGEVGLIKISSCVKLRGGVRIVMRCGNRALQHIGLIYEQNRQISQLLSAQMQETGEAVQKLSDALAAEKLRSAALQRKLFEYAANRYAGQKNILHFEDGLDSTGVRELADAIAGAISGFSAVFTATDGSCYSFCLAARSGDLRELGKHMTAALQGRGGGKPNFQQGSVKASRREIEAFFADFL